MSWWNKASDWRSAPTYTYASNTSSATSDHSISSNTSSATSDHSISPIFTIPTQQHNINGRLPYELHYHFPATTKQKHKKCECGVSIGMDENVCEDCAWECPECEALTRKPEQDYLCNKCRFPG